jgi:hypothetical protein
MVEVYNRLMPDTTIQCPACGAGINLHNPGIVTLVCPYCHDAIYWDGAKVEAAGKQSILPEGLTRLYLGAGGTLHGKPFHVIGRLRYSFGEGFWDEWYLEYQDNAMAWISEDNFELVWQERVAAAALPDLTGLRPGQTFSFQGGTYFLQEVGTATCLGLEGALPKKANTGTGYRYADAVTADGKKVLGIEYASTPPDLFLGQYIGHADIILDFDNGDWS